MKTVRELIKEAESKLDDEHKDVKNLMNFI